jgi:hypothetical protein
MELALDGFSLGKGLIKKIKLSLDQLLNQRMFLHSFSET